MSTSFFHLPLLTLLTFVGVELWQPGFTDRLAGWPLALSLVFLGMPHGAADFAVLRKLAGPRPQRSTVLSLCWYLLLIIGSGCLLVTFPALGITSFLVLSGLHFGLADARDLQERSRTSVPARLILLAAITRGLLIVSLLLLKTSQTPEVLSGIGAILESGPEAWWMLTAPLTGQLLLGAAITAQLLVVIVRLRYQQLDALVLELVEAGTLSVTFLALNPLFAIGLYLTAWHAWRHLRPLASLCDGERPQPWIRLVARSHRQAIPFLVPTLTVVACYVYSSERFWNVETVASLSIVVFAIVTLPHHLLIEHLHRRRVPGPSGTGPRVAGSRSSRFSAILSRHPQNPTSHSRMELER